MRNWPPWAAWALGLAVFVFGPAVVFWANPPLPVTLIAAIGLLLASAYLIVWGQRRMR